MFQQKRRLRPALRPSTQSIQSAFPTNCITSSLPWDAVSGGIPVLSKSAGDVGDAFDVLLTNNGSVDLSVAGFAFEVTVADTDVTLTNADFSTTAAAYIFAGDSFDQINSFTLNTIGGIDSTAQTLEASDVTNDSAGVTLAPGQSLALGEVLFNVANGATPGSFGLSFTGSSSVADSNNLAGPSFDAIAVDNFYGGTIMIGSVPEPGTALPLTGALLLGIFIIRYRRRLCA